MSAIVGVTKSKIQLNCPECKWNTLVDMMTFYLAALHVGKFECAHCKAGFYVNVELLDPRSPTLRAAVQSEQGGLVACDHEWVPQPPHGYEFCKYCNVARPTRSDGG